MKDTKPTKVKDINRRWHLVDVENKILGRISSEISRLLIGKGKPNFVRNLDIGDYVVVINSKKVKVSGNKQSKKKYFTYSGYPSGLKSETFGELKERKPGEIIKHAVAGMLPQNKLKKTMLKRLFIFPEGEHLYKDKFEK